jgi:hypothetical protein
MVTIIYDRTLKELVLVRFWVIALSLNEVVQDLYSYGIQHILDPGMAKRGDRSRNSCDYRACYILCQQGIKESKILGYSTGITVKHPVWATRKENYLLPVLSNCCSRFPMLYDVLQNKFLAMITFLLPSLNLPCLCYVVEVFV